MENSATDLDMTRILLKNGTALIHKSDDHVEAVNIDILIEGNRITKIAKDLSAPEAEVIECTDKIISPGFIDTHHHVRPILCHSCSFQAFHADDVQVWQTQLKGRHANHTLMQYFPSGNFTSKTFSAEDVFWGQLGGCLEMVDCGTTTVADYAHVNMTPEHSKYRTCHINQGI